jgi:hypothetical protein
VTWVLSNYHKDKDEDFEQFKLLCTVINPEAANILFHLGGKKKESEIEESHVTNDLFLEEVRKHAADDVSTEELQARIADPERYSDLDTIEVVGE